MRNTTCSATRTLAISAAFLLTALAGCSDVQAPQTRAAPPRRNNEVGYVPPRGVVGLGIHQLAENISGALNELNVHYVRTEFDWYNPDPAQLQEVASQIDPSDNMLAMVGYAYNQTPADTGAYKPCTYHPAVACIPMDGSREWSDLLESWKELLHAIVPANIARVQYWEAWNEPNDGAFFAGKPSQYDSLAMALCDTVHVYGGTCVGPALGYANDANGPQALAWLAGRLNDHFDIISAHVYARPDSVIAIAADVKANIGAKPLWLTETNHVRGDVAWEADDPELQDKGMYELVNRLRDPQQTTVDGIFFHDLQSTEHGIVDGSVTQPRYAYYGLRNALAGQVTPPGGQCTTQGGYETCNLDQLRPYDPQFPSIRYSDSIRAKLVDYFGNPLNGNVVLSLMRSSQKWTVGYKPVDAGSLVARFRIADNDPSTGNPVTSYELEPFETSCVLSAIVVDVLGNPVPGANMTFYSPAQSTTTGADGVATSPPRDCGGNYGISVNNPNLPPGYVLQSADGQYAYADGLTFSGSASTSVPASSGVLQVPAGHSPKYFLVTTGSQCTLTANARDLFGPVNGVTFQFYSWNTVYGNATTSNGTASVHVPCSGNGSYGIYLISAPSGYATSGWLSSPYHCVSNSTQSYCDGIAFAFAPVSDTKPSIPTNLSVTIQFSP